MTKIEDPKDELVGSAEAAKRLQLSTERIRQLSRAGQLPPAAGHLGRQEIWRWRDLENWAISTGRIPPSDAHTRQLVSVWRNVQTRYKLAVQEVVHWGYNSRSIVHVRVWEPAESSIDPPVVLLGNLEDNRGPSVTNRIEEVAMLIAVKFLGARGRNAQFYEYWPTKLGDRDSGFSHVIFHVGHPRGKRSDLHARALGFDLSEPEWREVPRAEIETLIGSRVDVYTPGTYTAELVRAVKSAPEEGVIVDWDPDGVVLAAKAFELLMPEVESSKEYPENAEILGLPAMCLPILRAALAQYVVAAREDAVHFVAAQDMDAPVILEVPGIPCERQIQKCSRRSIEILNDHVALWEALSDVRSALGRFSSDDQLELVPALAGGLTRLEWWEAGVQEPEPSESGTFGPTARLRSVEDGRGLDGVILLNVAEKAIATLLDLTCDEFRTRSVPLHRPSGPIPASGPITKRYLESVSWVEPSPNRDPRRIRLERFAQQAAWGSPSLGTLCGRDTEDNFLLLSAEKKLLWFEWPYGALRDVEPDDVVRADPVRKAGYGPVFLESSTGNLRPLPASASTPMSHGYSWGYFGTGPGNLAAAILQAALAAGPSLSAGVIGGLESVIREKVASGSTPNWKIGDLVDQARRAAGG